MAAGVADLPRVRGGQGLGEPGGWVLSRSRRPGAEGDELPFGVVVAVVLTADLLGGPVGEDGAVGQQGEGPGRSAACVDGVGCLVNDPDVARHDEGSVRATPLEGSENMTRPRRPTTAASRAHWPMNQDSGGARNSSVLNRSGPTRALRP